MALVRLQLIIYLPTVMLQPALHAPRLKKLQHLEECKVCSHIPPTIIRKFKKWVILAFISSAPSKAEAAAVSGIGSQAQPTEKW
ncbi:hypothetical protein DITRI_Ditri06bG0160600 [Diplodiscus trichospermus]